MALEILERPDVDAPADLLACALLSDAEVRLRAGEGLDLAALDRTRSLLPTPPVWGDRPRAVGPDLTTALDEHIL